MTIKTSSLHTRFNKLAIINKPNMSPRPPFSVPLLCFFCFSLICFTSKAAVLPSATFKYVNEGEFGPYIVEYDGNYRVLSLASAPFQLCFYNTTPNAYTLALRMATRRSESLFRWVWEANRGHPVGENATFSLGTDGNLVLAEADGRIAWQTNTANKGVVGFRILPNGNMVLYNSKGKFIWQSFDYPTDTLLVGQSLRVGGPTKLVSRASAEINSDGPFSFILESRKLALYYKIPTAPKPLYNYTSQRFSTQDGTIQSATLSASPDMGSAYDITLELQVKNVGNVSLFLGRPKYNGTLSILRIGIDGNLKVFTYNHEVDYQAWEETYALFSTNSYPDTECNLPSKCGSFGVCEENQCVACPSPKGLLGWSRSCQTPKVTSCGVSGVRYYKVEGVDNFISNHNEGEGPIKMNDCGRKCSADCKCLGYFYHTETSKCWIAYELGTLAKASNSSHVAFIKTPKK